MNCESYKHLNHKIQITGAACCAIQDDGDISYECEPFLGGGQQQACFGEEYCATTNAQGQIICGAEDQVCCNFDAGCNAGLTCTLVLGQVLGVPAQRYLCQNAAKLNINVINYCFCFCF